MEQIAESVAKIRLGLVGFIVAVGVGVGIMWGCEV